MQETCLWFIISLYKKTQNKKQRNN